MSGLANGAERAAAARPPSRGGGHRPRISFVVARDRGGVIGKENALPWHMPADLKHFRRLTLGKPVVMGRRTFESMGRALDKRTNIVLTRDPEFRAEDVLVARSADEALALTGGADEVMVIGGAEIFRLFLPLADRQYVTEIDASVEGDVRFPEVDRSQWREVEREAHPPDAKNPHPYTFVTLERQVR